MLKRMSLHDFNGLGAYCRMLTNVIARSVYGADADQAILGPASGSLAMPAMMVSHATVASVLYLLLTNERCFSILVLCAILNLNRYEYFRQETWSRNKPQDAGDIKRPASGVVRRS